jgi:pimeloyl-ACP methyl ester carboxylesterase
MKYTLILEDQYKYIEEGQGPTILLLHGLFGALSNWAPVLDIFKQRYRVIIPLMPIYEPGAVEPSMQGLTQFVTNFVRFKKLEKITLVGNSLGGHIALMLTLEQPQLIDALVLTGSSGLFEAGMGQGLPKRNDETYVRERVEYTFFDPKTASKELVNEVRGIIADREAALRVVRVARSAQRMNMLHELPKIKPPVCLIWGLNDNITPVNVAHEFHRYLKRSELSFIDKCGHAPMMEQPERFNDLMARFLTKHTKATA